MSDTLEIFGIEYTDVAGIIATDDNGNDLTYTRGSGIDCPIFTFVWNASFDNVSSVTCNKTYAECYNYHEEQGNGLAIIENCGISQPTTILWRNGLTYFRHGGTEVLGDCLEYVLTYGTYPYLNIRFYENGTINVVNPSEYYVQTLNITENGTITNSDYFYNTINVSVPSSGGTYQAKTISPTTSQQTVTPDSGYDALSFVTINAMPSGTAGTPTATKGTVSNHSVSVTPSVTNTTGYITGSTKTGTAVTVSASELVSGTYSVTSSGTKDVTNYASASVPSLTLPSAASSTSSGTSKATISRSTSNQYINIPTGFNDTAQYYTVSATPNGTVTAPSTITGTTATVSTGTNTLTLTKSVSVTPNVTTAGYISTGTAGNASVSLTASVTTKAAATITPGTTNQTIASGTYLTGTQTIAGDADLVASNIVSGVQIFGVTGNVVLQNYYTGSSAPSSSLGSNGDLYLQS